jgi:hypothetical protein
MTDYRIYNYPKGARTGAAKLLAAHDALHADALNRFNETQQAAQTRRRTVIGLAFGIAIVVILVAVI